LKLIQPTSDTNTEISDADPDTPGLQVRPDGTEVVREISFDNEEVSGLVNVREYNNPPQKIRSSVSQSVTAAGAVKSGDVSVLNMADITPDSEAAEESGATVTFTHPADEVDNPDDLTVVKDTYSFEQQEDTWRELNTTVEDIGDEEITVSAQAESFSLFTVAEVQSGTEEEETTNETDSTEEPDDSEESDSFIPGFGVPVAVVAMIALAMLARRKQQ
jgi:PGF-CTERM protein